MSEKKDDGGPAFPQPSIKTVVRPDGGESAVDSAPGMSLRDAVALATLPAIISAQTSAAAMGKTWPDVEAAAAEGVGFAFVYADAFLTKRSKP